MRDDIARDNEERWTDLVAADVAFARPLLNLTVDTARAEVDAQAIMGDVTGKDVLCLASGGGQQSAAFAVLGARVTVTDLTPAQLEKDRIAAAHYNADIQIIQADMRDLSMFDDNAFDIVWHAFSINFVPSAEAVFGEVARVLRPGGLYRMQCGNPFFTDLDERQWNGSGYTVSRIYVGGEIEFADPHWDVTDSQGQTRQIVGPREFCHTLSDITVGLARRGFVLRGIWEEPAAPPDPEPGSWDHMLTVAPPWLTFWAVYRPDIIA